MQLNIFFFQICKYLMIKRNDEKILLIVMIFHIFSTQ